MSDEASQSIHADEGPVQQPVGRPVPERASACKHCGSVACANGGGAMSGYWVIHPGCDDAKAAKERA